jgi:hypothetical protein
MESVCEGVLMMCRPYFGDQMGNARYVENVWRVGFEVADELERGSVELGTATRGAREEETRDGGERHCDGVQEEVAEGRGDAKRGVEEATLEERDRQLRDGDGGDGVGEEGWTWMAATMLAIGRLQEEAEAEVNEAGTGRTESERSGWWWHCAGSKDPRFGEGKVKPTWRGGTHELGMRIGKLLEQIVF